MTVGSEADVSVSHSYLKAMEWWGIIDYQEALDRMTQAQADRVESIRLIASSDRAGFFPAHDPHTKPRDHSAEDSFFYLEHPPVITYGRATPSEDLKKINHQIPTLAVPRGGLATYHAPGQLVGYIVLDLSNRSAGAKPDIHAYLRALELGLIAFLRDEFGLATGLRQGFTGVWTQTTGSEVGEIAAEPIRKLVSIGVSARKWVTSHGFALNIHPDMTGFQSIVPCGITDAEMTSVELELQRAGRPFKVKPMQQWAERAHLHLLKALRNEGWLT